MANAAQIEEDHVHNLNRLCDLADRIAVLVPQLKGSRRKQLMRRESNVIRSIGRIRILVAPSPAELERIAFLESEAATDPGEPLNEAALDELAEIQRDLGAEWMGMASQYREDA
ncbi:MAG: hypothetical protein AAGA25_17760, partial [Planctomycetota bacterium]